MPPRLVPLPYSPRAFAAASAAVVLVFCGPASPQSPAPVHGPARPMESAACVVRVDTGAPVRADTVRIALFDSVNLAGAPFPSNDAERLVFRQMYETLVRVDCEGQVISGAATRWQSSDNGKTWTFALRDTLRYWDGTPYPPSAFVKGRTRAEDFSYPVERVDAFDEHTLRVVLMSPELTPRRLTESDVPIASPFDSTPPSGRYAGTGLYRPDPAAVNGQVHLVPADSANHLPVLEFWQPVFSDSRDLLDRGADLLVSSDPGLLEYAARRGDRVSVPLPWTRAYSLILAQPIESLPPDLAPLTDSIRAPEMRQALARDAVRAESRGASGGIRSGPAEASLLTCFLDKRIVRRARVVYQLGDRTGQDLAERLVALVPPRYRWRAAGLGPREFGNALRCRQDVGYVISKPLDDETFLGGLELPLVDTRAHAILRRGSPAWVVDGDGTLRMPLPGTIPP